MNKYNTAQKVKFSVKDFFSKCDQIRSFLRNSLMETSFFKQYYIHLCYGFYNIDGFSVFCGENNLIF